MKPLRNSLIAILLIFSACKKEESPNTIFTRGSFAIDVRNSPCNGCNTLLRIDSQSYTHTGQNSYYTTNSDGVDLDIAVTDLKPANGSGYKWSSKPSVSIPYIGGMVVLKSDTSYWLSQGFKLTDFVKDLHLK
jgi:hypothetical protein